MRISASYSQMRGVRDSPVYQYKNKNFKYRVQFFTKDWTIHKRFFLNNVEVAVDDIPNDIFAAIMQSDEWELIGEIKNESPAEEQKSNS